MNSFINLIFVTLVSLSFGQGNNGNCNNGFDPIICAAVLCLADPCENLDPCNANQNCVPQTSPCQCCPGFKCVGQGQSNGNNGNGNNIDCSLVLCADVATQCDFADCESNGKVCVEQNTGIGCCPGVKCVGSGSNNNP